MSDSAKQRLKQIFSYIRALAERRAATFTSYSDYGFCLPLYDLPEHETISTPSLCEVDGQPVTDVVLTVGKAEYSPCPVLPETLVNWLQPGWDDPTREPKLIDRVVVEGSDPQAPEYELFTDDPARRAAFTDWLGERDGWAEEALPAYRARKIYDKLYSLYSELAREKDRLELIIGDGLFETALEDGTKMCHPIVLERVVLEFDAETPCFSISDSDANPSLYSRLLRSVPDLEWSCLSEFSARIEGELIHPFEVSRFNSLMTSFANSISSQCEFSQDGKSEARFSLRRFPVLFTRSRASGYLAMLDKIIDDIETAQEFSPSLLSIIGEACDGAPGEVSFDSSIMSVNGIDRSVLLEKQANREQLLIAKKLGQSPAVLVQGPPGTGKTHTISNIIGDLLAQGKSVLVTSQTSKALSVLRDKISEPIRPLCVSVLDDNRKQLEQSLNAINDYMSSNNVESLDAEAARFESERSALIDRLTMLKQQLVDIVALEYTDIIAESLKMSPKEAALYIAELTADEYIPDDVPLDTPLPLAADELTELYQTNALLSADEQELLSLGAPASSALLTPPQFARICSIVGSTDSELTADGAELWKPGVPRDAAQLGEIKALLTQQAARLSLAEPWMLGLAQSAIGDASSVNSVFSSIDESIKALSALSGEITLSLIDSQPIIPPELISKDTDALFDEIVRDLDSEKINWFTVALRPKWKQLLDSCVINGEKPDTKSEVCLLSRYHKLLLGRQTLERRWASAISSLGGPSLGSASPEATAAQIWPSVNGWLNWYRLEWQPIESRLAGIGFDLNRYMERLPMEVRMAGTVSAIRSMLSGGLIAIVESEYLRGDRAECLAELSSRSRQLLQASQQSELIAQLRDSIEKRDANKYNVYFDSYDAICLKSDIFNRRMQLLEKLRCGCPKWAAEISARVGVNGGGEVPPELQKHWLAAQLRGELNGRESADIAALQAEIAALDSQLSGLTRELISRRAWSAELRTMLDPSKKRALATWVELVKRVGKGTGKRAEQLLSSGELRRAMKNCRRSVPVWIMPLSGVAEYFEPSDEKFDVLIIDEASQADLTGLISLYLAKKVIVVGDDKQVSPTPIGLDIETSAKLRREFLEGIPAASMYDELVSIYDLGKANYEPITLREHFRCATDIINFSNYYTYNGIICPLRDSGSIKIHPSTVAYHVKDGATGGKKTNPREAEVVTSLIAACIEQPEYSGSTFGVITMVGDEQALLIDRMLREHLSENVYQSRQILCGSPAYFQGDERDIIFISLVDSPAEKGALQLRKEGYNEMYAKRYNVAASRARDQLWVVHSLDPSVDLKPDDIRLKLIRHAEDPAATAAAMEQSHPAAVSAMEQAVSEKLSALGFRVSAREKVGNYTVALLCEGGGKRVAIECDGDRPADSELLSAEMNKQSVLERLGWTFCRLRASEYYRCPEAFIEKLPERIAALGVTSGSGADADSGEAVLERIYSRSEELLLEWSKSNDLESDSQITTV